MIDFEKAQIIAKQHADEVNCKLVGIEDYDDAYWIIYLADNGDDGELLNPACIDKSNGLVQTFLVARMHKLRRKK